MKNCLRSLLKSYCQKVLPLLILWMLIVSCSNNDKLDNNPIVGWGDSMMSGSGSKKSITDFLETSLGRETKNFGVGGLTSESIAILQGGKPFYIKVSNNNTIVSEGKVLVENVGVDPINKQTSSKREGQIEGVKGVLTRIYEEEPPYKTIAYEFERDTPGEAKKAKDTSSFLYKDALENRRSTVIIWAGRNDDKSNGGIVKVRDNIRSMVNYCQRAGNNKILILSVCNGISDREAKGTNVYDEIHELNKLLKSSFGGQFVDVRKYLVEKALEDLNIVPTKEDEKDMELDCIPRRLLSDNVHLNKDGYKAVAMHLAKIIQERGY